MRFLTLLTSLALVAGSSALIFLSAAPTDAALIEVDLNVLGDGLQTVFMRIGGCSAALR